MKMTKLREKVRKTAEVCSESVKKRSENATIALFLYKLHKKRVESSAIFYTTNFEKILTFLLHYEGKYGILNGSDVR